MKSIHIAALILAPGLLHAQQAVEATGHLAAQAPQAGEADLAQQLANPISSLISVPIQSNIDFGVGPGDGTRWITNIQPVIPFELSENWNLISRTILLPPALRLLHHRTPKQLSASPLSPTMVGKIASGMCPPTSSSASSSRSAISRCSSSAVSATTLKRRTAAPSGACDLALPSCSRKAESQTPFK